MNRDKLQSEIIEFLRFPLILGVVFIHLIVIPLSENGYNGNCPIYFTVTELLGYVYGRAGVPFFFLINGYFFFHNLPALTFQNYIRKLRSRCRTQLIPFLTWGAIFVTSYIIIFPHEEMSVKYIVSCLLGDSDIYSFTAYPIAAYQLWFLRDLIAMAIISPLIYLSVKYGKEVVVVLWGLLYVHGDTIPVIGYYGLSTIALFFFSLGCYLAIQHKNIITEAMRVRTIIFIALPLLIIAQFTAKTTIYAEMFQRATSPFTLAAVLIIASKIVSTHKFSTTKFLAGGSFMLYALHVPYWDMATQELTVYLGSISDIYATICYLLSAVVITAASYTMYAIIKSFTPSLAPILGCKRT